MLGFAFGKHIPFHNFVTFIACSAYNNVMEEYFENLARAYHMELSGSENPIVHNIIGIIDEQIYLLSRLKRNKIVGYILSLKECVKGTLNDKKTPSMRTLPQEGGINRIINLELELLTLLDTLDGDYARVREYENRTLCLLGYLV